jgi:hypothetical protein
MSPRTYEQSQARARAHNKHEKIDEIFCCGRMPTIEENCIPEEKRYAGDQEPESGSNELKVEQTVNGQKTGSCGESESTYEEQYQPYEQYHIPFPLYRNHSGIVP